MWSKAEGPFSTGGQGWETETGLFSHSPTHKKFIFSSKIQGLISEVEVALRT